MEGPESAADPLRVLFVDRDGRLEPVATALSVHAEPVTTVTVDSLADARQAADERAVDCVVVLDAPATGDCPDVDGLEEVEAVRERLPDHPVVVYSLLGEHETVRRAHQADVSLVSASADEPEIVYRQLQSAAGVEAVDRSSRGVLDSLMRHYPHDLYLKDDAGRFEAVSVGTAETYGLDRSDMVNLSDYDILDTYDEETHEEYRLLATGGRTVERIDHWTDDDDRDHWTSVTKAPRYDDDGNPVGIVGSSRGMSEEKRKEQMTRQLHTVSRDLVRAQSKTDIGQTTLALAGDVPAFADIELVFDREGLDPVGVDTDGGTLFDRFTQQFEAVVDTGEPRFVTEDGRTVDDPDWTADPVVAVLPLGGHGALGVAADAGSFTDFGIDLTKILAANLEAALDRADRERELERQNDNLEEFAGIVSHDLRNPLNVASAAIELLAEETDSRQIERIQRALGRMEELIETLLTLARKGQVVGDTERVELEAAARTAWQVVDAPAATLTVTASGGVVADRNRVVELFENLFRNAAEHGREDIAVTIGVRTDREGFYVADDGPGIDEAHRDQLFEMGYSQNASDTGYGLYIVSTIADAHGWDIEVCESNDGGARFDVVGAIVEPY